MAAAAAGEDPQGIHPNQMPGNLKKKGKTLTLECLFDALSTSWFLALGCLYDILVMSKFYKT